ncbi:MAG: type II toxin-antitoxin system VapC family toxin [Deltaproteobacteria bacterium]|nr:type II toxin-antitoxin system VapC family toxin [Deltaproteobacteria bacterium]
MICLDASVVGMLIAPDEQSAGLLDQYETARLAGESFIAPMLLPFEMVSVLRKKELRRLLSPPEMLAALQYYYALQIDLRDFDGLWERILALCQTFGPALTAHDASYVALAEKFHTPLWTADKELYRAVSPHLDLMVLV